MRPLTLLLAATVAATLTVPALAQVQQGSPNAANQSLANQGQMRSMQQNQTTQSNMNRMNAERGQGAAPPPPSSVRPGAPTAPGIR